MNSLTYLTRKCPRNCDYCDIVNTSIKQEITPEEWIEAFKILKAMDVKFNLILGNETWLLGSQLTRIMYNNKVPYALYTTCYPPLFREHHYDFLATGLIDNVSCGIDHHLLSYDYDKNDMQKKSFDGWKGLITTKTLYPHVDCQGTITVSKQNYGEITLIVQQLTKLNIFCGINFIHHNIDGGYDFFPKADELKDFLFEGDELYSLELSFEHIRNSPNLVQNIEMLKEDVHKMVNMGWHCKGDPYGGPTIDADGSLRCCGYRPGTHTPKFSIFDLPKRFDEWQHAVWKDANDCPGCFWSYPWMYDFWKRNPKFRDKVFIQHAGKHIDKDKWAKRSLCAE